MIDDWQGFMGDVDDVDMIDADYRRHAIYFRARAGLPLLSLPMLTRHSFRQGAERVLPSRRPRPAALFSAPPLILPRCCCRPRRRLA